MLHETNKWITYKKIFCFTWNWSLNYLLSNLCRLELERPFSFRKNMNYMFIGSAEMCLLDETLMFYEQVHKMQFNYYF